MAQTLATHSPRLPALGLTRRPLLAGAALLLLSALILRSALFGDPFAGYDEQFYLLTGSRMLHGAVPYVDIWDRKPIGLFLIYALAASLGGNGVLAYQLLAALSVAATGFVIALLVRRHHSLGIGLACGFLYIVWVGTMGGQDGQSPLFYNLPMAAAALLTLRAASTGSLRLGAAAMALCGLALTIKTSTIFESCFFGLTLVAARWTATRDLRRTAEATLLYMALGAAPFLAAMGWYAAIGHFDAFWFANATSAALRRDGWTAETPWNLLITLAPLGPVLVLALAGLWFRSPEERRESRFLLGWTVAATIGFVSIGYFYQHYALPLLVPLVVASAPLLARWRHGRLALVLVTLMPVATQIGLNRVFAERQRPQIAAIVAAIPPGVRDRCMLVYGGPPILYELSHACLVSRFAFPFHFYSAGEATAIGADQVQILGLAFARRPLIVTTETEPFPTRRNPRSDAFVAAELARHYRVRATLTHQFHDNDVHILTIWERK
jgi:4-amino-4-deoxy-L-arabinose transferase-like glycosyltransferase